MKFYNSLLILLIMKSVMANNLVLSPQIGKATALLFIRKLDGLYMPIDSENIRVNYTTDVLYGVCPPTSSVDETATFLVHQQVLEADKNYYSCEEKYMPLEALEYGQGKCSAGGARLARFSYREIYRSLIVYAICLEDNYDLKTKQARYAMYKIFPYPGSDQPQPEPSIDYKFENYFIDLPEGVEKPYRKDDQKKKLGRIFNGIMNTFPFRASKDDSLIPQQLVPTYNLPNYYSKGITNHRYNYRPQWLSLAKDWDHINLFIKKFAEKVDLTIYAGTFSEVDQFKICSKRDNTTVTLYAPLIWWIFVKEDNSKRGIIIGLSNYPSNLKNIRDEYIPRLCNEKSELTDHKVVDTCEYYGWEAIRRTENAKFVHCCHVTKTLSKQLLHEELELKIIHKTELPELMPINSIKVSTLLESSSGPTSSQESEEEIENFKRSKSSRQRTFNKQPSTRSALSDSEVMYTV